MTSTTTIDNSSKATKRIIRVVVIDDHPIVRRGLVDLINEEPDLEVCGEAGNAGEGLALVEKLKPDVGVIDISLDGVDGLELLKNIKSRIPDFPVLVVSIHDEMLYAERALRAGALGYLNKKVAIDKVVDAIRQVRRGKVFLSERMAEHLLHAVVGGSGELRESPVERLSDRELEVYQLIGEGLSTRQIAEKLSLSTKTIETYRENIKSKLNLPDANHLIRSAVHWVMQQS